MMVGRTRILLQPGVEETLKAVREAVVSGNVLLIVGGCRVEYEGRARSILSEGERIVVLKPDGSVLVHRPTGHSPVNWQPPRSITESRIVDGELRIESFRRGVREVLRITFSNINLVVSMPLVDRGEFCMHASEEEMREAVLLEPRLIEEGFRPIKYEKRVESGFIDVYGLDSRGRLTVVELKRKTAGRDAVLQLSRYVRQLKSTSRREVRGILAAPSIARGAQSLLEALGLEFKPLSPEECYKVLRERGGLRSILGRR